MNLSVIVSATVFLALAILSLPILNNTSTPQHWLNVGLWKLASSKSSREVKADLIIKNGVIFTSDASLPFADSMAVAGGWILRVGNYSSVQDLVGNETKELNLEGKVVVPGFIDSHVHLIYGGLQVWNQCLVINVLFC
uniref:Uncharacterized protein LOC101501162 isoform X5 n=1 Tax=Rhizophora mucronata TaxID=61149 RepID=A0A2P2KGP9_RHIMU